MFARAFTNKDLNRTRHGCYTDACYMLEQLNSKT